MISTKSPREISPARRWRRALAGGATALVLAAGLTLAGCATTAATPSSSTSTSQAASTAVADDTSTGTTAETISDTAAAAEAFLATLTDEQRDAVLYAYDDDTKTTSWTHFPVTFVDRAGLNLNDLSDEQKEAARA